MGHSRSGERVTGHHSLLAKNWQRRVPGSIVALVLGTLAVVLFQLPVETIGSRFGGIPLGFPVPHLPSFAWDNVQHLFQPAVTIALLAAIESLLCAVVADGMIDDRHDSNQELMAQGLANIFSPLFGGIAATGAIARTATNVKAGTHSDGRDYSRRDPARYPASCCSAGQIHPAGHAQRGPGQRRLSHGRMATISPACASGPRATPQCIWRHSV